METLAAEASRKLARVSNQVQASRHVLSAQIPTPEEFAAAADAEVEKAFDKSQGTCGSPRVRAQLRRGGLWVSNKAVEASMARQGLCARPKRKRGLTGQSAGHTAPSDLLGRDFSATAINQKWCGDFKEVATAEGPVFLATVEDLYSRRMVGFATSDHYRTAELANQAVNTAVAVRGGDVKGVIFHSDKGGSSRACARGESRHRSICEDSGGSVPARSDSGKSLTVLSCFRFVGRDRRWACSR